MSKAKRALALALAGTMAISNFAFASANELTTENKLDVLKAYEIVKGDSTDPNSLALDTELERYRAVVLMLRLTEGGSAAMEAYDYEGEASFADAGSFSSYVERLMAYTYNNDVGIDGFEDGTFRPTDIMTEKAYAKMMLESLGYDYGVDFTWSEVADMAEQVGIVEDANDISDEAAQLGEMVEMTYDALATIPNGESISLGEIIGKPVVITETELSIEDVDAPSLKQIVFEYSKAVDEDSATDLDNYSLEGADQASLTNASAELVGESTVIITLGTEAQQQETLTVAVEGVKDTDGNVIESAEFELSFLDSTIPTILGAEVVGNKTLKATFSEPMETVAKANFEVKADGKKLYIKDVQPVDANNVDFYVTLISNLKEGEVSLTVDGAEDYAKFNVIKDTIDVDVVLDEEAPVVVDYKDATPTSVTFIFDEDIDVKSTDINDFYHTNSKNTVDAMTDVTVSGNELTLNFIGNELPQGTAYVYVNDESVVDLWGNENDQVMMQIEVEIDEAAPSVEESKVDAENQMTITVDEKLDQASAEDEDNYTLIDADGEEADLIKTVTYNDTDKTLTVEFKENLSGDYVLFIEDVEDLSGNAMAADIEFNVVDLTAPLFSGFAATLYDGAEDQILKIDFSEEMTTEGKYSIADEDNYIIDSTELSDIADAYIDVVDNGKSVEIHIPTAELDIDAATVVLELARVADATGNYTSALAGTISVTPEGTVGFASVEAIDKETVVVTLDDQLTEVDIDNLEIKTASKVIEISSVAVDEDDDNNTVITFTVAEADQFATDGKINSEAVELVVKAGNTSENKYGEKLDASAPVAVTEKIAPEVSTEAADKDAETATITFTETIVATHQELIATDLVVTLNGDALKAGVDYNTTVSGANLVITFADGIDVDDEIEINLDSTVNYLTDGTSVVEALEVSLTVQ